jgi:MoxR-like ATPase
MAQTLNYSGTQEIDVEKLATLGRTPLPKYLPPDDLVEAVKLAILLERPLLIEGDPGCGKTRLARAVADELGLPYQEWYVKSTSQAKEGLYTYDAMGRLRDAQLSRDDPKYIKEDFKYLEIGPFGKALTSEITTVLLIDEIDKADPDFPNDLLLELDQKRFFVNEVTPRREYPKPGTEVAPPIIFITSNRERKLPEAFLRRCLYFYISFPTQEELEDIVRVHFDSAHGDLLVKAVKRFVELYDKMKADKQLGKSVSTSELIDWFQILYSKSLTPDGQPDEALIQDMLKRLSEPELPYFQALLKTKGQLRYQQSAEQGGLL